MGHTRSSKIIKKAAYVFPFLLIFQNTNYYAAAASNTEIVIPAVEEILKVESSTSEEVNLYEEPSEESTIIESIPNGVEVVKLEVIDDFTKVSYPAGEEGTLIGFIESNSLAQPTQSQEVVDDESNNEQLDSGSAEGTNSELDGAENEKEEVEETVTEKQVLSREATSSTNEELSNSEVQPRSLKVEQQVVSKESLQGYALKDPTNVYAEPLETSKVLKSYEQGKLLKFHEFKEGWYQGKVYIDGEAVTCYIKASDVGDELPKEAVSLSGYALLNPTNVYAEPSVSSKVLKSYSQNSVLKYSYHSPGWYTGTVYLNGKAVTCYIKASDVGENKAEVKVSLSGIAAKSPTKVYSSTSTDSTVLKTYNQGAILKYYDYSSGWYTGKVIINGVAKVCYIRKSDVETINTNQTSLEGLAINSPTKVYMSPSKSSTVLKSYSNGSVLKFKTYTENWYIAKVYRNGKSMTAYIHVNDVEKIDTDQKNLEGIAVKSPTKVYASPSLSASVLKSYSNGSLLKYKTYTKNWYIAKVYRNGKPMMAYIHVDDVENAIENAEKFIGKALKSPTSVYRDASKGSSILKSYEQGSKLIFHSFTKDWYKATVYLNGEATTGFIHTDDVNTNWKEPVYTTTSYDYSLNEMLDIQMANRPRTYYSSVYVSSAALYQDEKNAWRISGDSWNVRTGSSTNDGIIGQLFNNDPVLVHGSTTDSKGQVWYKISAWTVPINPSEVAYYINPDNFKKDTPEYFQFLRLSGSAGANVTEVNNNVLSGKGILHDKAEWFIQASSTYSINEMYLISHALLETGNGTSDLATGIKIKVKKDSKNNIVYTDNGLIDVELVDRTASDYDAIVYNMYGIGAYDSNANLGGARYAYNKGWTTPEKAIVGGAQFVAQNYVSKGQDTIYKMRWNPENPGTHQYATDIGWAVKQVNRIKGLYDLITDYSLEFDVPDYK
ncbi:N-acetylglucosaminidase [Mesobacillus maritimus]|uniref:glucosaminidase domain-containing protein n=1 Tax=Mesobacillus maritimus TaxID=1643336 RepID=UPI002040FBE9|nr:glucosaminidase domain-containing protein [Mesobacillus maritimus]MCM3585188.1 N-acetylglucosaminidase [Mesobacillus maritimus]